LKAVRDRSNGVLRLTDGLDGTYTEAARSHKQWRTLYSPFLFVFAVYFYAMATFHLQGCPVRLRCLLIGMCEETSKYFYFMWTCVCISQSTWEFSDR